MHKMGLVDFWCYQNETFEFEDGHMLLRGSNGSGKSVTMQSFIPLLLDGNKSSERLDSFGTRSRKMETYLIDENSDREERIGYLYLEFKRQDSDLYKTIGMGLRARKGKPLQSWYFVIEDNRRVGIDFSLMHNHLTLSEKQLKNILGNQVISSQGEYMKRVNEALFGFENLDDYSDAISLLLQLRSPKLSNSLNPQKINEILAKSLQPLSDEDLRPMSEAIINMDNLQDQLESLKQSLNAAMTLEQAYHTYNQAILMDKWNKYLKVYQELSMLNQLIASKTNERTDFLQKIDEAKQKLQENRIENEVKKKEQASLRNNDIEKWIEDIAQLEKDVKDYTQELEKKYQTLEQKESACQNTQNQIDHYQNIMDEHERKCQLTLKEMDILNENLQLSEHIAIQDCFDNRKSNYDFSYTRQILHETLRKVENGLEKWDAYDKQREQIAFFEEQESRCKSDLQMTQDRVDKAEDNYQQTVESYLEFYYQYNETNQVLKFHQDQMDMLRLSLIDYEKSQDYSSIQNILNEVHQKQLTQLTQQKIDMMNKKEKTDQDISELKKEKDRWENMSDPEPEKTMESLANRQYLDENHIEYVPLYKLLDFSDALSEQDKSQIEEILSQMKLLDALVVSETHRSFIESSPEGCEDYYLWTSQSLDALKSFVFDKPLDKETLLLLLSSLGIQANHDFMIHQRYFQSGIIEGNISHCKQAVYIGYKRRLKMKEDAIALLTEQIHEKEIILQQYIDKEDHYQNQLILLHKEYHQFKDEKELKKKINQVEQLRAEYSRLEKELESILMRIQSVSEKMSHLYNELQKIASEMLLSVQKNAFIERKKDIQEYQSYFEKFKDDYMTLQQTQELKQLETNKHEQYLIDLDDLNYEINQYEQKKEIAMNRKQSLQKQLDEAGYTDLAKKLTAIENRLVELEEEYRNYSKNLDIYENELKHIDEELIVKEEEKESQSVIVQVYKDILIQEVDYQFVIKDYSDDKELIRQLRTMSAQFNNKKSISDYQNQLQHVYFEQIAYLSQYNVVQENVELCHEVEDISNRLILKAIHQGKKVSFLELIEVLKTNIDMQEMLIQEEDRHIFEEILVNTIGKKIRERIQVSRRWVEKIQDYMQSMNTSSGLQLSLKWKSRKAIDDQQMDTQQLVELLEKDYRILKENDRQKISNHFRSKIASARKMSQDESTTASFHQLMKEVMDYREWFDFTLFAKKPNENRKELTSHIFYAYSGGEKALSMYVPLFSAVAAKFESAREDAPLLIALDEAFAGVDENNIDNMFALITKFGFDYIMNSQVLWGDYPSCPSLAIYELFRPNNAPFVTVVAYIWNGHSKSVRVS